MIGAAVEEPAEEQKCRQSLCRVKKARNDDHGQRVGEHRKYLSNTGPLELRETGGLARLSSVRAIGKMGTAVVMADASRRTFPF